MKSSSKCVSFIVWSVGRGVSMEEEEEDGI